jgi:ribosomal protein S18 acetylase RimI-like enzyme
MHARAGCNLPGCAAAQFDMISIDALSPERLDAFFQYLAAHIAGNGLDGAPLSYPLSREQSVLSGGLRSKFADGMHKAWGEPGWRRAWVAISGEHRIAGHIDIRSADQLNAEHRVVLGMGVDREFRGQKIGQRLLEQVISSCRADPRISWIDLQVMEQNIPATRLYEKMQFEQLGVTRDMFRIGGVSYGYSSMALNVET